MDVFGQALATESGNIYAKPEDRNLYLSAGFKPPKHIQKLKGKYEIISVVDEKQHAMYKKIGFEEQNPINYLKQIIIPFIGSLPSVNDVRNISEWLANNWEELTKDIDEDKKEELISTLSASEIVLDNDLNLNTAKSYYHPDFFSDLPISLQDKKYSPLKFEDNATQKNWSDFLSKLGASTEIISEHIVTTIQSIIEDESDEKAIELLKYISNHFEWFDGMEYDDENIFEYLADSAWIPVEKPTNSFLVPENKYKKLQKPSELILNNDYMIAGGAHYTLSSKVKLGKKDENGEFTEKDIAEKLGLLVKLPNESVFGSLRRLRNNNSQQQEGKVLNFAKEFYKYLGRSHIEEKDIPDDITEKSVFIKGHWLPSSKVFQASINLTGIFSWDDLVASDGKESSLAKGLIRLGVLEQPDNEYLVSYLCDLPQNKKLDKQQLKDAKAILNQLQNNLEELVIDDIPLVSRSDQLIAIDKLYVKDLPAYDNSDKKSDQLEFCQRQFEILAKHCSVVSLADNIRPELDIDNSKESEVANNSWNDYIRSDPFKSAVLRLIYHEGIISDDEIKQECIDEVLPSEVLLMDSLVVRYFIDDTWIYDDIDTPTYQDTENSILYLLNQDDDEDMCDSIAKFIRNSSDLSLDSFSLIGRFLRKRHEFNTVEDIHNLLDKKNIKLLSLKIEIDKGVSLYGNISETENIEEDEYNSLNNISESEQNASHEDNASTEVDTQSSSNTSTGMQRDDKSGVEIPPPINPKKSNSSNVEDGANSFVDHNVNRGSQKGDANRADGTKPYGSNKNKLGSSTNNNMVSPNDHKPVYVGKEREFDSDKQREQKDRATEIGNKGENYILERSTNYTLSKSNKFEKAPTNNKGYDILEKDSNGDKVRYIEVKTLTGVWGEGGVAVTESQLEFAQVYDNWWLFVVENINTQNTTVHIFENPVQQANRYIFDHSWKQLAESAKKNQLIAPKEGDTYLLPDGNKYEVISIETKGKLYKVRLKETKTGIVMTKKFDPSWEKF